LSGEKVTRVDEEIGLALRHHRVRFKAFLLRYINPMSDLENAQARSAAWMQVLDDGSCGPDLEYDNDYLALTQAAAGKPESQFGPAEPPNWLAVREASEALLDRSRDLRLALYWVRSGVRLMGYAALPVGLELVIGMAGGLWDQVHPLPDPDDGDPYARVNALTLLREMEGLLGDLRIAKVVQDRAVGEFDGRAIELAMGLAQPGNEEEVLGKETLANMVAAALDRKPELALAATLVPQRVQELQDLLHEKLGSSSAPDLKPLLQFSKAVASLMPSSQDEVDAGEGDAAQVDQEAAAGRGLSGAVRTRDEALRAIDMVCTFLERTEPSNPAPLFLRRARQLVNHSFLQLMKELAPAALSDVARSVGVDPDTVESPERP
jgi:type VI secretion system protein ImpA